VLWLAGPMLLASTYLTALVFNMVLGYESQITWNAAVLYGAIASATDPVAVVALMKELGASRRLATLVEGESLLNDGTAMVVFNVVFAIIKGDAEIDIGILGSFIRLAFGGPLLGIVIAIFASSWLKRIYNDSVLEVNMTIVCSYLIFFLAESTVLKVSGVLAMTGFGFYMNFKGKTKISVASEESVHHVWSYIGFFAETIIFLLTGVICGDKVLHNEYITGKDYGMLFAHYVFQHLIRFFLIFISWPLLKKMGYGLSFKQLILLAYAGLRGAVGLTLALIVYSDNEMEVKTKTIILFHTAGLAFLTIIINGTTTGFLI
jgi:NhaP-type Na+/H+ or K+/H+ antiporter